MLEKIDNLDRKILKIVMHNARMITAGSPYIDGAYRRGERGSDSGAWLNCLTVVAAGLA